MASPVRGLTVVAGGKYTTYRVMAKDAVDAAARELSLTRGVTATVPDCCTEDIPLLGAEGFPALWNARETLSARTGLRVAKVEHLLHRYGSLMPECWP